MLHVFLVDTGIMLKFDMELAVESVAYLMEAVHRRVFIPANKQVLLSASGEPLAPTNRVASYPCCGTENQPIFLFSKSTIESPLPPSPSINLGSVELLMGEVEKCLNMRPNYETLVARAKLAEEFHILAVDIKENCDNLVNDQFLQKSGWKAVVLNLDLITSAFEQHVKVFEEYYQAFFTSKVQYSQMIQNFDQVLLLLKQLPLLPCILNSDTTVSLLEWISTHDKQTSIEIMVRQCQEALDKCKEDALLGIVDEAHNVLDLSNNEGMKEIKGLSERLESLQHRLIMVKQIVEDQTVMAKGFQQNQIRAEHIGDSSVLPDLCASHQRQLTILRKNHYKIREIRNLCSRAKDELSTNLHARLRWVMYVEKSIFECDSRLIVFHESLKRIKKRLDIVEQVFEAPRMYVLAVLEVLRRKSFSIQFFEWSRNVSDSAINARTEELRKREMFTSVFGNHFVKNLFPGLDGVPLPFAEEPPASCDDTLPNISVDDVRLLQQMAPDLMAELHIGDSLESSEAVKKCLSQSSLTKLVDPRQNKTLEETVTFREKAQVDINQQQLTMSVLHREISRGDIGADLTFPSSSSAVATAAKSSLAAGAGAGSRSAFQIGSPSDSDVIEGVDIIENIDAERDVDCNSVRQRHIFKAGSLRSLSTSSSRDITTRARAAAPGSSSVDSEEDTMFHSAELDFTSLSPRLSSPLRHDHHQREEDGFVVSPSSVKSGSGKSTGGDGSSGKSSSSPIAIKSPMRSGGGGKSSSSRSLSPESIPTPSSSARRRERRSGGAAKGSLFSLPDSSMSAMDHVKIGGTDGGLSTASSSRFSLTMASGTDEKDNSQNSFRSLSEAIRSSEVNDKLAQSEDVLRATCRGVRTLRQDFTDANSVLRFWVDATRVSIGDVKRHFGTMVDAKEQRIRDLETSASEALTEHKALVKKLNLELEQCRQQVKDLSSKQDTAAGELAAKLSKLQFDNEELGKLKEDGECQIQQLHAETKRLRELYEQLQGESQRRDGEMQLVVQTLESEKQARELESQQRLLTLRNDNKALELEKETAIQTLRKESEETQREFEETRKSRDSSRLECDELKSRLESAHESSDALKTRLHDTIESHRADLEKRQADMEDLTQCKQTLTNELSKVRTGLDTLQQENVVLRKQIDELSESTQQNTDDHLSHVSSITSQNKELKRKLAEKEQELSQALMMKDSLETQKQTNFNAVFNKIKKDKDAQIRDMASKIAASDKELQQMKSRTAALNSEIGVHKEAYDSLKSDLDKSVASNKEFADQLCKLREERTLSEEDFERRIDGLNEEKLRVIQELKVQYDQELAKEKASLLHAKNSSPTIVVDGSSSINTNATFTTANNNSTAVRRSSSASGGSGGKAAAVADTEEQSLEEVGGKSEHAIKEAMTSSIEEGLDVLEIDQLMEKVKELEGENGKLKKMLADKEKKEKEKVISASPKAQKVIRTSSKPVEKFSVRDLDIGSVVLLCFDDKTNHYVALTLTIEKYFLHPESLKDVQGRGASDKRFWMFAFITEKELCVAKKPNNKFNLPVNTYFSRIRVKLYDGNR